MNDKLNVGKTGHTVIDPSDYLDELLDKVEREVLHIAMERKGNQLRAVKQLSISRGSLRSKLRKYFEDTYFRNTVGG